MKFCCLFVFLSIAQITYPQTEDSLCRLYEILNEIERNENLNRYKMLSFLKSYENSDLKNNAEFSEWRSEAIIDIINHPSNLQKMLSVLKDREYLCPYVLEELAFPIHELDYSKCIENIRKVKGDSNVKKRIIAVLRQGD